jgi:hypothetical protein
MDNEIDISLKTVIEAFFKTNESYAVRRLEIALSNGENSSSLSFFYQNLFTIKDRPVTFGPPCIYI